ncbi:hypothetical protein BAE46_07780 [Glaciecola punicea]|jgi:pimeloyl-ACP methyl ester carboxylesterase|uniref:alpha/beta hydrolase n=1 Tax=Glaciecola punicea TaxID=56804 RepID=UPI000872C5C1|nr:alpha/beta hydrolase [Glaciecola punicea]OFA31602.1 hypothetical protein BAE46_07780 [Glaciecola punicea]
MLYETQIKLPHLSLAALANSEVIDPRKPTLVCLHGFLDNANSFATLIPLLNNYQCVAIDMAGHGKSEHRSIDAYYHLSDYAYDVYQLIVTLQLRNFALLGHSLGAIVSSLYASTRPKGLRGFIAIESCGPLTQSADTTAAQLRECFISRAKANKAIIHPRNIEAVVKSRCAVSDLSPKHAQQIMIRNLKTDAVGNLQWRTDKRLRTNSAMRMTEEQASSVLANIECPRLLILGNQGFEKIKAAIALRDPVFFDVPISTFEGGHHVHLESVTPVANCIDKYCAHFFKS